MTAWTRVLVVSLLAIAALFVAWFAREDRVAVIVFAVPPLLLALLARKGAKKPAFWAGLLALAWFSHGVMVAWSRPADRTLAIIEILLSLLIVAAASVPGMRARFSRR